MRQAATLPSDVAAVGASAHGLTRTIAVHSNARQIAAGKQSEYRVFWFDDLKEAYSYPAYGSFNGKGVTIATVGLNDFSSEDTQLFYNHESLGSSHGDLAPTPKPLHYVIPGALPSTGRTIRT